MIDPFEDHCWQDVVDEEILDIYKSYQRETFLGRRPAVLAIDLYSLVFEGGPRPVQEVARECPSSCGVHAWNCVEPIQELLFVARLSKLPVIYTTNEIRQEIHPTVVHATKREISRIGECAYKIQDKFQPQPSDLIVYKQRASAFFGTPLIALR